MKRIFSHQRFFISLFTGVFLFLIIALSNESPAYWFEFWWMLPIAFVISLSVNIIGISSAALFVPFFILIFPFFSDSLSHIESITIGLITEAFGLTSSALAFLAFGLTDKRMALYATAGLLPFLVLGVLMVSIVPESILLLMIAGLLMISVFFIFFEERLVKHRNIPHVGKQINTCENGEEQVTLTTKDKHTYIYCRTYRGHIKRFFGYGVGGFFQGAVGFGAGELGIVSMMLSRIPIRVAIGTSHLIVALSAICASVIHLLVSFGGEGVVDMHWNIVAWTLPAVIIAGQISPYVASRLPTKVLERFMAILFTGIAIALLVLAVQNGH
ncbi:MAG: sulfite exporter TauE/SafE family protein [Candidatus Paceibacterota bacterium]